MKQNIEELEKYLMVVAETTLECIKKSYDDRLYEAESYDEWLLETAIANGYKPNKK